MARYLRQGDAAVTVEFGSDVSPELNRQVRAFSQAVREDPPDGFVEVIPTYRSATVVFDPGVPNFEGIELHLRRLEEKAAWIEAPVGKLHVVPVRYGGEDGPDLEEVAALHGLTAEEVVRLHANREYTVYGVGFSPGFLYLGGVPPELHTPRLGTPRKHVPAGSVGLGGQQTGVYPIATPGGWRILGRTNALLFDVTRDPPSAVQTGDRVLFEPVLELAPGENARVDVLFQVQGEPALEVLKPGLFTTVQDLGRWGCQAYGVSVAGAMDPLSLRVANLLAGNDPGAAALELTIAGPMLRVLRDCRVALAGASMPVLVNGQTAGPPVCLSLQAGDTIEVGRASAGARAYLAVEGGIDVPVVLSSRSTYARAGFGGYRGRPLEAGDVLAAGTATRPAAVGDESVLRDLALPPSVMRGEGVTVRVVLGPQDDHFSAVTIAEFLSADFTISNDSDRMGYRLAGHPLKHLGPAEIVSDGVVLGSIQVPPHGNPIVMLADRASMGGYPKIATVVSADVRLIAQSRPGMKVRFRLEPSVLPLHGLAQMTAGMRRAGITELRLEAAGLRMRLKRGA